MAKALIITKQPEGLLHKTLFEIVKFEQDEVAYIAPGKDIDGVLARGDYSVIIPVGEEALNQFGFKGITRYAGRGFDYEGVKVLPIFSPGYIEHNTHLFEKFAQHLDTARNIMLGIGTIEMTNQIVVVTDAFHLMDLISYIKKTGYTSFDFETTKLTDLGTYDPDFYVTSVAFTFQQGSSYVIPLNHFASPNSKEFIETCMKELGKEVFNNPNITKIAHNIKFDLHCAATMGITELAGPLHDTMVMHHLIDEVNPQGLKDIVRRYYSRYAGYDEGIAKIGWSEVPLDELVRYNALDSDLTFRIYWMFTEILMEDGRLYKLFRNLSAPATKALFLMERRGMLIDKQYINEVINKSDTLIKEQEQKMLNYPDVERFVQNVRDEKTVEHLAKLDERIEKTLEKAEEQRTKKIAQLRERIAKEEDKDYKTEKAQENGEARVMEMTLSIRELQGSEASNTMSERLLREREGFTSDDIEYNINFDSPKQMHDLLYTPNGFDFSYPRSQWDEELTGTGKEVLELIKDKSKFTEAILIYRQMVKIYRTYLVSIRDMMDTRHRIHGTFKQIGTKTGRLSVFRPNLQNVITRTKYKEVEEMVSFVKKAFGTPKGYVIVQGDLSQAELRIIAEYAKETNMIKAYKEDIDLHELTASKVRGMTVEQFRELDEKEYKRYRYEAKSVNFGFIYSMSAEGYKDYARTNYGIEISIKKARDTRAAFFKTYPRLLQYHNDYINKAKKFGYVRTLFGRKVHLPDIESLNRTKYSHAERNSVNAPIQGTAGEWTIFALALISIRAPWLELVNSVHDSIIPYVKKEDRDEAMRIMAEAMENPPIKEYFDRELSSVEMKVDFEASDTSWGDLKEV